MSKQSIVAFAFGVVFVITLLVLAIAFPTPTSFQYTVFRIILALAAAGVAAMIPGFIRLKLSPSSVLAIQAGGAIAVFVIVYFFNPAQLAVEVPPSEAVVSVSIQDYHILHGATASPVTLESVSGPATDTDAIVKAIWEQIFPEITPQDKHVDLQIAISDSMLTISQRVDIWLAGFGIQGMGAARKILETDPDRPIDLKKLFAGEYPGNYFRSDDKLTLYVHSEYGRFETGQIVVFQSDSQYSFDANTSSTILQLKRRLVTVLVDTFEAAGTATGAAENLAVKLKTYIRSQIEEADGLRVSPHSRDELMAVHNELKDLPLGHPMKGFQVEDYNVDYIISGTVTLE